MSMTQSPTIEIAVEAGDWPPEAALRDIADNAVAAAVETMARDLSPLPPSPRLRRASPGPPPQGGRAGAFELSILFTNDRAMRELNAKWRRKDKPTNVLSFPQASGAMLGDIVLAAETLAREAALADKPLEDHMAHLIIHGFLHLLGYDHEDEAEAEKMEQLERAALARIGIADPYAAAQRP
jgi:probable rRNA maturation factor